MTDYQELPEKASLEPVEGFVPWMSDCLSRPWPAANRMVQEVTSVEPVPEPSLADEAPLT